MSNPQRAKFQTLFLAFFSLIFTMGFLTLLEGCAGKTGTAAITPGPTAISAVAFSPDGKILAAGVGNRLKVWDLGTGQELMTLEGHSGAITCAAFAPGGKELATGAADKTIKLWDM